MGKHLDSIVSIMRQRRTADSTLIIGMIENRDRYNGDVVVPLPDVSGIGATSRPGPNFFQEAIDGHARSANAKLPKINCPVHNPGSQHSEALAEIRQGAMYAAWSDTQLHLKLARSYRHLAAYGTHAMVVVPDEKLGRADIQLRDPLTAFPELRAQDDIRSPADVGFLYAKSAQWIKATFPDVAPGYLVNSPGKGWDTLWDIVEWIDEDDVVMGVMGPRFPAYGYADARPYGYNALELGRWQNKAHMVPVVAPRRVTLDRIMGQMTSMINLSDLFGRMMSLQLTATEKAIFPDLAIIGKTGLPPTLVGDVWQDGRTGNVNMVYDGAFEVIGKEPGPGTMPMLQLVDQHIRGTGGASPLYAGANGGMRTGAGIDALGDYGVNPMVAESQLNMQLSLTEINKAWVAVQKGYFGDKKFTCYLGLPGSDKTVTYTPNKDFDSDANVVAYISPGADENKLAVAVTQLVATELMSRRTGREQHPMINDPQQEEQYVTLEKANDAVLAGMANEITQPNSPITTAMVALFAQYVAEGDTIYGAMLKAQANAVTGQPAPGQPGAPPTPVGPDGQPVGAGLSALLAAQGAGPAAAPGSQVPGPNPDSMNLRHILQGVNEQISPGAT